MAKCNSATIAPAVPAQITTTVNFHAARAQYKLIEYGVEVSLSGVVTADAFHSLLSAALAAVDKVQVLVIRTDKALTCFDAVPLPPISASRGRLLVVALIQSGAQYDKHDVTVCAAQLAKAHMFFCAFPVGIEEVFGRWVGRVGAMAVRGDY